DGRRARKTLRAGARPPRRCGDQRRGRARPWSKPISHVARCIGIITTVRRSLLLVLVGMLAGSSTSAPQSHAPPPGHYSAPIGYDGRFTLVRLRWGADLPSPRGRGGFRYAWNHDYPRAEQNLSAIIRELTFLDNHNDGNEILMLDDPDLFK